MGVVVVMDVIVVMELIVVMDGGVGRPHDEDLSSVSAWSWKQSDRCKQQRSAVDHRPLPASVATSPNAQQLRALLPPALTCARSGL
jgi:hypothetical protein